MNNFGTPPTSNNPPFGNNPAVDAKYCYHLFLIDILWRAEWNNETQTWSPNPDGSEPDTIGTNGLGTLRDSLNTLMFAGLGLKFPKFGGSITKTCLCLNIDGLELLGELFDKHLAPIPNGHWPQGVRGGIGSITGYAILANDCDCGGTWEPLIWNGEPIGPPPFPRTRPNDCVGHQEFDILGQGGQPLNYRDGFWITSTGEHRPFPSASKQDILQDILDTELNITLPCCTGKKTQ